MEGIFKLKKISCTFTFKEEIFQGGKMKKLWVVFLLLMLFTTANVMAQMSASVTGGLGFSFGKAKGSPTVVPTIATPAQTPVPTPYVFTLNLRVGAKAQRSWSSRKFSV